jgi:hypothetical protein
VDSLSSATRDLNINDTIKTNNSDYLTFNNQQQFKSLPGGAHVSSAMGIPPPPSYENAVSQKRNGIDLAPLHQNAEALGNVRHFYGTGPIGAGDGTMSTNSTWDFNTIDNPFYRAMNDQSDYSFVSVCYHKNSIVETFLATTKLLIESGNMCIETKRNVNPYIAFLLHPCVVVWRENQD